MTDNRPDAPDTQEEPTVEKFHLEELIRLSDFESIAVRIEVQNTTTHMPVKDWTQVELLELQDRGAILSLPPRSCSTGHNLLLKFRAILPDKTEIQFHTTAKVDQVENGDYGAGPQRIVASFLQFDEESWRVFCGTFTNRQADIENFFRAARGF